GAPDATTVLVERAAALGHQLDDERRRLGRHDARPGAALAAHAADLRDPALHRLRALGVLVEGALEVVEGTEEGVFRGHGASGYAVGNGGLPQGTFRQRVLAATRSCCTVVASPVRNPDSNPRRHGRVRPGA